MPLPLAPTRRLLVAGAGLAALGFGAPGAAAQTAVRFSLDWRFEGPAAPFTLALDKGYFKAEGLDVTIEPAAGSREPVGRVASGAYDIGFGDVNSLVRLRDENPAAAGVKAVMMVHDRPPFAIVGRRSRGVAETVSSLRRRRLGAPAQDAAFAQWPVFRALNGIDEREWAIRIETVGFPVREPLLAQGEVDAVFGYAMTAAVGLKARGVPADDIVVMNMSDHGLELYGNAILVSQKFAAEKPEAVRGFLRALVKGLRDATADPAAAVETVIRRNEVARRDVELERLDMVLRQNVLTPWVKENGVGRIDHARFERALDQIGLAFPYKNRPKVEDVFDDRFLPPPEERKVD
ncbi:MAG TPA: ABC transporter substrate-binding protein [Beijerinckiaceae bacterium]|jgi:NitT/TauT family transport system substrate-binding protein